MGSLTPKVKGLAVGVCVGFGAAATVFEGATVDIGVRVGTDVVVGEGVTEGRTLDSLDCPPPQATNIRGSIAITKSRKPIFPISNWGHHNP